MEDDDVLSIWDSFPDSIKGATLLIILTYLVTFMAANYWASSLPVELTYLMVYWPFAIAIWITLIWLGFSLIVTVGVWIGGRFSPNFETEHGTLIIRAKKVILYIPTMVGSALSVSAVFMGDIFRKGD